MTNKLSSDRHIYLYAKGHYGTTGDIMTDLRLLMAERCGFYNTWSMVSKNDAVSVLLNITLPYLQNNGNIQHFFLNFIQKIHPDECWKMGYIHNKSDSIYNKKKESLPEYDYYTAVCYACLSQLRCLDIKTIVDNEKGKELGEADFDLFPMLKKKN